MQVISLLILVLLMATIIGKNKSPYSRIVIGSVFGIFFFSFWQFFKYYTALYNWSELYIQIAFIAVCIVATLISALLIKVRHELTTAIASFLVFVIFMLITYSQEIQIKNEIAITSGYFDNNQIKISAYTPTLEQSMFTHTIGGYQVFIPSGWALRVDKGQEFKYYQLMHDDTLIAEFRPKCFETDRIALTDIVTNLLNKSSNSLLQPDFLCNHIDELLYFCQVNEYKANNEIKRISWLGMRADIRKGVDLDFILHTASADTLSQINNIIASLRPTANANSNAECLGLSEWF